MHTTASAPAASAPAYIAADLYTGTWTRRGIPAGCSAAVITAAQLAALAPSGVIWESFGHVRGGREGFARTRYVADPATGGVACYDSTGRLVIRHPASRPLRVLAK